jgi:hypothetical protein
MIELAESGRARERPDSWLEKADCNEKFVGEEEDYWVYIDHNKDGNADMRVHCYNKWNFKWGYYPAWHPYFDYEIHLNGHWVPVSVGTGGKVIGHQFTNGKWT